MTSFAFLTPFSLDRANAQTVEVSSNTESRVVLKRDGELMDKPTDSVWLGALVRVPIGWTSKAGNNVLTQSVSFLIPDNFPQSKWYLNGRLVAESTPTSNTPSKPKTYLRLAIPQGLLNADSVNQIAIQFGSSPAKSYFLAAPSIAGYTEEISLAGDWTVAASVDEPSLDQWPKESKATMVYDRVVPGTTPLETPKTWQPTEHLAPEVALSKMRPAEDVSVELVLAEPDIAQPVAMSFDTQGRLWVAEYRQYPYPAGLSMVSRDKYYRAVYDRLPEPPPRGPKGADRISIHSDRDGNGTFEHHQIFVDGLNIAPSVLPLDGGVWVLNPPYLLYYADANRDNIPDGAPEVHLEGFGIEDTHSVANSLRLGPDGWIYGALGSTVTSAIRPPGSKAPPIACEGPAIWRYHPTERKYEIFAEGGGNAFCVTFDAQGRLYSGHNGNDTRGFHYYQGAYFKKGDDLKHGVVTNPFAYGYLMYMQHPPTPRFTHALVRYNDDLLPERYFDRLLGVDPLNRRVVTIEMQQRGTTFSTNDSHDLLASDDPAFRPIDIQVGPDGAVYVADFCEQYIAHGQHFLGMIDPTTGRIWRVQSQDRTGQAVDGRLPTSNATSTALIELLKHPSQSVRKAARDRIISKHDPEVFPSLTALLKSDAAIASLEALWTIHSLDKLDLEILKIALHHPYAPVRGWAVRLAGDFPERASPSWIAELVELSSRELDPEVLAQLACTAKRLGPADAIAIVQRLSTQEAFVDDPNFPLLVWWTIERHIDDGRAELLNWLGSHETLNNPLVEKHLAERIVRRLLATQSRRDALDVSRIIIAGSKSKSLPALLRGFDLGIANRTKVDLPNELIAAVINAGGGNLSLRLRLGDSEALKEATAIVVNLETDPTKRVELIESLGKLHDSSLKPIFQKLVDSKEPSVIRIAAVSALAGFDDAQVSVELLNQLGDSPPEVAQSIVRLAARRPDSARELLKNVANNAIDLKSIPEDVVDLLRAHPESSIQDAVSQFWPSSPQANSQEAIQKELDQWKETLALTGGNPYNGRTLFLEHCGKCHRLFNEGGQVGPDLTRYNRDDQPAVLLSIVRPSIEIREGYQTQKVLTTDGRIVTGFLVDQDNEIVTLRESSGESTTLLREEIEEMAATGKSLMPEGLLKRLTDEQVRDLFAYLKSGQPLGR